MGRKIAVIVNPVSGRRHVGSLIRKIARLVHGEGGRFDIRETVGPGHATVLARQIGPEVDAVLAVGGDGTVCEIINGLPCVDTPLLVLGAGTENLLARELRMPTTAGRVARTLLHGRPIPMDLGKVNGRHFLVVAGAGFDAECVVRMHQVRQGHITHLSYFWPIWRTFWTHRFPLMTAEVDGVRVFDGRGVALVGMISRYSAGLRVLHSACWDDGLLDLCVFGCTSKSNLLLHAYRVVRGRHPRATGVIYRQGQRIRISSPEAVPVEVDGELCGELPIECSIEPGGARILQLEPCNQKRR